MKLSQNMNKAKVLIFGASGKLGSKVLQKFIVKDNYIPGILIRENQALLHQNNDNLKVFKGNLLDSCTLEECIHWADIVINCIGKVSYRKKDRKNVYNANYIVAKNILEKCEKHNKKLIHTSSVAVYGNSQKPVLFNESDVSKERVLQVKSMYCTSKFESDRMVLDSTISKIVLRPGSFISGEKSTLKTLYSLINKGIFPSFNGGASFVLIDDVVNAYIKAVELIQTNSRVSHVFNLGGNNLSFREILEILKRHSNKSCIKIPWFILLLIGYINDYILEPLHKGIEVTSENVRLANRYCYIDSDKAKQVLDYKITPIEECLKEIE